MSSADVVIVSLASTGGLRRADDELVASLARAGARVVIVRPRRPREVRTLAATDLSWAVAARQVAKEAVSAHSGAAVLYSSTGAALLWPKPAAVRFDSLALENRPGRHGIWQRPVERRRLLQATLLVPWAPRSMPDGMRFTSNSLVVPVPIESSREPGTAHARDIAAIAYARNPVKKGMDRIVSAWSEARRADEELVVVGAARPPRGPGIRSLGFVDAGTYRALLRRARVFIAAPRREDYGLAQLEALADGCLLVTCEAPGPYAALPIARQLDPRLVGPNLAQAIRTALDDPIAAYSERSHELMREFTREAVDELVARQLLPLLMALRE